MASFSDSQLKVKLECFDISAFGPSPESLSLIMRVSLSLPSTITAGEGEELVGEGLAQGEGASPCCRPSLRVSEIISEWDHQ